MAARWGTHCSAERAGGGFGLRPAAIDYLCPRIAAELDAGGSARPLIENATFRTRTDGLRYDIDASTGSWTSFSFPGVIVSWVGSLRMPGVTFPLPGSRRERLRSTPSSCNATARGATSASCLAVSPGGPGEQTRGREGRWPAILPGPVRQWPRRTADARRHPARHRWSPGRPVSPRDRAGWPAHR